MNTSAEAEMSLRPANIENMGIGILLRVMMSRARHELNHFPFAYEYATDLTVHRCHPADHVYRSIVSERLLYRAAHVLRMLTQPLPFMGTVDQQAHARGQHVRGRLQSRENHEQRKGMDGGVGSGTIGLNTVPRPEPGRDRVFPRTVAAFSDHVGEVLAQLRCGGIGKSQLASGGEQFLRVDLIMSQRAQQFVVRFGKPHPLPYGNDGEFVGDE
ncbi:hypothetical protein GPN2_20013 [Streptomyces murinus]